MTDEWGPSRRWIKVLCLHGADQSAASLRAQLVPLTNALPSTWHFHFLDAPHVLGDAPDVQTPWSEAAALVSLLDVLPAAHARRSDLEARLAVLGEASFLVQQAWTKGGINEMEALVGRKSGRSLERGWSIPFHGNCEASEGNVLGLYKTLDVVGDYMRENGPFDGFIGASTGADVLSLIQTLLVFPLTGATAHPTFFPLLDSTFQRSSLPPPSAAVPDNDTSFKPVEGARELLPPGYAHTQVPFAFGVHKGKREGVGLGRNVEQWCSERRGEGKLLELPLGTDTPEWTAYAVEWLKTAAGSAYGDEGAETAFQNLHPPAAQTRGRL